MLKIVWFLFTLPVRFWNIILGLNQSFIIIKNDFYNSENLSEKSIPVKIYNDVFNDHT